MKYKIILIVLVCGLLLLAGSFVQAAHFERDIGANKVSSCDCQPEDKGWVCNCICQGSNPVNNCHVGELISHPICACCGDCVLNDFIRVGVNIVNIILRYLGVIALALFVLGGIMWITSGGAQEKIQRGRAIIVGAVIGMVIVLTAFIIVQAVMKALEVKEEYFPKGESGASTEWPKCKVPPTSSQPWCYGCVWTGSGRGCQEPAVKTFQETLNALNCNCGQADGKFGSLTRACTKKFQAANGLTVDGMVGESTWAKYKGAHNSCP